MKIQLKFSVHAKDKMKIRKVRVSNVYAAITTPDNAFEDVDHGTLIAIKKVNGNSVIVVYNLVSDGAKVITLFYTTKLDKLVKAKMARGSWKRVK